MTNNTFTVRRTERGNFIIKFDGAFVADVYAMHVDKCRDNVPEFAQWDDEQIAEALGRIAACANMRAPNLLATGGWSYFADLGRQVQVRAREIVAEIADRRAMAVEQERAVA